MKSLFLALLVFIGFVGYSQSLVSMSPSTGVAGNSVNVTITGSGTSFTNSSLFFLASGTNFLTVNNVVASSATSVQATVVIPANAVSGTYSLSTLSGITPITLQNAFTVTGGGGTAASITAVDPNEGYQGQFLTITISGSHTTFLQSSNTTAALIKTGGTPITALGAFAMDDTTLMAYFNIPEDAALGAYTVGLTTSSNGILTKANAFTVIANPHGSLSAIEPNEGNKGETLDVTISGTGTTFTTQDTLTVELYSTTSGSMLDINSTDVVNDSTIVCNITIPTTARSGTYDVYVVLNEMIYLPLSEAFTVIGDPSSDPRLKSVSPATAHRGEILDVTISAANTHFMQSSETIVALFAQATSVEASSFNVINDSVMTAHFEIPIDLEIGVYDVGVISDLNGYLDLVESFTITGLNDGLDESGSSKDKIQVYPNPVKNELVFETKNKVKGVYITDITGKQITIPAEDIRQHNQVHMLSIDRYQIGTGIYFITIETDQGVQYRKFIVD